MICIARSYCTATGSSNCVWFGENCHVLLETRNKIIRLLAFDSVYLWHWLSKAHSPKPSTTNLNKDFKFCRGCRSETMEKVDDERGIVFPLRRRLAIDDEFFAWGDAGRYLVSKFGVVEQNHAQEQIVTDSSFECSIKGCTKRFTSLKQVSLMFLLKRFVHYLPSAVV